ncbi:hypothetical protein [Mucilaginibacter myungsuensis]|uniref:Uncharacterized protein n=1 Tax=Mucilaginibacter myungsuensis TaxID=649104 RepID=A0A929PW75_9SPHI|nr:hypothetical protein [Mucilaginibacter myungsuensis]MBE9660877.1 hypothetical protein [Mucilaginibacter myungsuensis]MDN3600924.1 hypothetical protein [Mucilaginibacter myungsuensis]
MKVLKFKTAEKKLTATEKLIKAILCDNIDAFANTSRQFLRNNAQYTSQYTGLIA